MNPALKSVTTFIRIKTTPEIYFNEDIRKGTNLSSSKNLIINLISLIVSIILIAALFLLVSVKMGWF